MQRRYQIRSPADTPALPPVAAGALQLLPPLAYTHQPASSFNVKFAGQAPSKVGAHCFGKSARCSFRLPQQRVYPRSHLPSHTRRPFCRPPPPAPRCPPAATRYRHAAASTRRCGPPTAGAA